MKLFAKKQIFIPKKRLIGNYMVKLVLLYKHFELLVQAILVESIIFARCDLGIDVPTLRNGSTLTIVEVWSIYVVQCTRTTHLYIVIALFGVLCDIQSVRLGKNRSRLLAIYPNLAHRAIPIIEFNNLRPTKRGLEDY